MSYKIMVVCGTGMGSSMILKMMVEQVVDELQLDAEITSDLSSDVQGSDADIFIAGSDLAPMLNPRDAVVIGVRNLMDTSEIKAALSKAIALRAPRQG